MSKPPSLPLIYLRSALGMFTKKRTLDPKMTTLKGLSLPEETLQNFAIDPNHVRAYQECMNISSNNKNNSSSSSLPMGYLPCHLFSLPTNIVSSSSFPVSIVGSIHESCTIESKRPIREAERVSATCRVDPSIKRSEKNDWIFTTITDIDDGEANDSNNDDDNNSIMSIRNEFRILNPDRNQYDKEEEPKQNTAATTIDEMKGSDCWEQVATWDFPIHMGRSYAKVNGDINPIHIHPITAKLFGFRSCIAHGMYSVCKLLNEPAILRSDDYNNFTITTTFTRPVFLPNQVLVFVKENNDNEYEYVIGYSQKDKNDNNLLLFKDAAKGQVSIL